MHFKDILPILALASAAPLLDPRALIIKTVTAEVVVTITDYTTLWVTPGSKPTVSVTKQPPGNTVSATTAAPPVATTATTTLPPPPPPVKPTTSLPPPPPAVTPTTSSTPVVAPVPTTTTLQTTTAPAAQPTLPAGGSGTYPVELLVGADTLDGPCTSGSNCAGDITHFNPSMGAGACGYRDWTTKSIWQDTDLVVALSSKIFGTFSNIDANNMNKLCNRSVKIKAQAGGQNVVARVVDRCGTCPGAFDLDLSPAAFDIVAPKGDGRVSNVQWEWV